MQPTARSTPFACRVAEIPEDPGAGGVNALGQPRHVCDRAAAVVHVRVHHERGAVERGPDVVDQPQLQPALGGQALEHVAVGREAAALDDQRAGAQVERRGDELVQVHGGRVADQHLPGPCAQHVLGEQVAGPGGDVDPVRPAGHEPLAPLVHAGPEPVARGHGQAPERVAVEVDPVAVAEHEPLAEAGQRIGRVECRGVLARHSHSITAPQHFEPGSRCSMWPSSSITTRSPPPNEREISTGTSSSSAPWTSSSGVPCGGRGVAAA